MYAILISFLLRSYQVRILGEMTSISREEDFSI